MNAREVLEDIMSKCNLKDLHGLDIHNTTTDQVHAWRKDYKEWYTLDYEELEKFKQVLNLLEVDFEQY